MRLFGLVIDRGKDDVEDEEYDDVKTLTNGWSVAEQVWMRTNLICAKGALIDQVWPNLVEEA